MQIFRNFMTKSVLLEKDQNTQLNTAVVLGLQIIEQTGIRFNSDYNRQHKSKETTLDSQMRYHELSKNKSRKSTQEIQLHGRDWVFSPALGLSRLNMLIEVFVTFCRSEVLSSQCSLYIQNTNNKDQIQTYHCCTKPALPKQPRKTPYRNVKLQPPWSSEIERILSRDVGYSCSSSYPGRGFDSLHTCPGCSKAG